MVVPGVHERMSRVVVDRLGHHRVDDADVVGDRGQLRKDRAQVLPARSAPLERVLRREADQLRALKLRDRHALGERLGHRLALHLGERGLVVERLQVRGAARHVQVDDPLDPGREMQRANRSLPSLQANGSRRRLLPRSPASSKAGSRSEASASEPIPPAERPRNARRCSQAKGSR